MLLVGHSTYVAQMIISIIWLVKNRLYLSLRSANQLLIYIFSPYKIFVPEIFQAFFTKFVNEFPHTHFDFLAGQMWMRLNEFKFITFFQKVWFNILFQENKNNSVKNIFLIFELLPRQYPSKSCFYKHLEYSFLYA